jgi:hypothetical protein
MNKAEATTPTHIMRVLDESGDRTYNWDPKDPTTVRSAKSVFDDLISKGQYLAYSLKSSGETRSMDSFDAAAEEVILTPSLTVG